MVGKVVQFTISHSVEGSKTASNGTAVSRLHLTCFLFLLIQPGIYVSQVDREYGIIKIAPATQGGPPQDVAMLVVASGFAKVRDSVGEGEEAVR